MRILNSILLSIVLAVSPVWAQSAKKGGDDRKVNLDFHDVDIQDVVKSISEITKKNFVLDDRVRGKVTIISPQPVSVDEAYQAFLSALQIKNLCTVEVGKITRIVPLRECKEDAIELESDQERAVGDQVITRLLPLQYISVNEIKQALNNLVSKTGSIVAYGPTNTLIITDSASNIRRLTKMIQKLDKRGFQQSVEVIPLKYAQANDVADKLLKLFEKEKKGGTSTRRRDEIERGEDVSSILPDERTNSLIAMATREGLNRILDLVTELDRKIEIAIDRGRIHVKYLQHADAEELSQILSGLLSGASAKKKEDKKKSKSGGANRGFTNAPALPWEANEDGSSTPPASASSSETPGESIVQRGGMFEDEVRIAADPSTNALIITASPNDYQSLAPVIDQLDVRRPQVFVEALIMEVMLNKGLDVGLNMYGSGSPNDKFGALAMSNLGLSPLALAGLSSQQQLGAAVERQPGFVLGGFGSKNFKIPGTNVTIPAQGALFRALATNNAVNVLSAPNILTTDNKKAEFMVGEDVPLKTSSSLDSNQQPITNFSRQKIGIQLSVTPQINEGDEVTLEIEQKVQEVNPRKNNSGFEDATFSERTAKTTVVAQNGQTIAIGGLIKDKETKGESKVPLLGDIPLLGYLFRDTKVSKEKINLIIFLTPHVIHDPSDLTRVSVKKNNERRKFNKKQGIGENKALYDYDLDKGLNMAPPPPSARKEQKAKKRFDYDRPTEEESSEPTESDVLSQRTPRRSKARSITPQYEVSDAETHELLRSRRRPVPASSSGNPFADVRPPSSN